MLKPGNIFRLKKIFNNPTENEKVQNQINVKPSELLQYLFTSKEIYQQNSSSLNSQISKNFEKGDKYQINHNFINKYESHRYDVLKSGHGKERIKNEPKINENNISSNFNFSFTKLKEENTLNLEPQRNLLSIPKNKANFQSKFLMCKKMNNENILHKPIDEIVQPNITNNKSLFNQDRSRIIRSLDFHINNLNIQDMTTKSKEENKYSLLPLNEINMVL